MSEFADITLLECNRRESTQATSDGVNNALYTNRMGGVISLDTGDTIESGSPRNLYGNDCNQRVVFLR